MGKYDFDLDLSTRNSISWIVRRLRPGTRILELGPANGRLTRYLAREMHCKVDIVEIDVEAGNEAALFADIACIGPIEGNIDSGQWLERLSGREYDYIVCADVLEHLRAPSRVLGDCLGLLKKDGSVLVSVPNIAHNAVIIGLMQGKFEYQDVGLLDNTHIHFFTRQSFRNMVSPLGYGVAVEDAIYVAVPDTELGADYGQIDRAVARGLKVRKDGIIYQGMFELKKRKDMHDAQETVLIESWPSYICECFPLEIGEQNFTQEKHCVCNAEPRINGKVWFDFDLTPFKPLAKLRIDPLNTNCLLRFIKMELVCETSIHPIENFALNGIKSGELLIFADEDPQIFLDVEDVKELKRIRGEFEILSYDDEQIPVVANLAVQAGRVPAMENRIIELENNVGGLERHVGGLERQLDDLKAHITELEAPPPPLSRKQLIKLFIKSFK